MCYCFIICGVDYGVFSHCSPSQICDIVRFVSSTSTTMATPEAALKLEIARLTGIVSPLAYVDVFS
jgi:hypothetical protein